MTVTATELARRVCAEGEQSHPGIELSPEHVEPLLTCEQPPTHLADFYLACACVKGDPRAIARLERDYIPPLIAVLRRSGVHEHELEDTLQVLRERLLMGSPGARSTGVARLTSYSGMGPLSHWLRICAAREGIDRRRARRRPADSNDELLQHIASAAPGLDHALAKGDLRGAVRKAFFSAVGSLEPRLAEALRRRVLDGVPSNELARRFGVHRATVDRWLITAREQVARETREQLMNALEVDDDQADSVIKMVTSNLDLSISAVFEPPA